jgi:hypothetical protein
VRAAWLHAGELVAAGAPGAAAATLITGLASGALLVDVTRAVALSAYAGAPSPDLRRWLRLGLVRTPGMISIRAVELLLYFCLLVGDAFLLVRSTIRSGPPPLFAALWTLAAVAPSLALGLASFTAARVAQTLIARGLPPATALAGGYDLVWRRFPSLARLALAGLVATSPLLIGALLVPWGLRQLLLGLAALWVYAALTTVVGRDGRLLTG